MYATWVVRRAQLNQQYLQSASVNAYTTIGSWVGEIQPVRTVLSQFPGMPVGDVDAVAIIPVDAANQIQVGDVFFQAEKGIGYTATMINAYTVKCIVSLKTLITSSTSIGPGI